MAPPNATLSASPPPRTSLRTQYVWLSLLVAMTGVGGLLLALDRRPAASMGGMSLVASSPATPTIEAIFNTRLPISADRWGGIIISHSGSMRGSAATLAAERLPGPLDSLESHFIIGNGAGMDDGELHVSSRWLSQESAHHPDGSGLDEYNDRSIGICLIGDGDRRPFTKAQIRRLVELVETLERRLDLPNSSVLLARDVASTSSPGRLFPEAAIRNRLAGL